MTIPQWKEYLQNLIRTNDKALLRAIVVIGNRQTAEELKLAETVDHNDWGFGTVDARFMTEVYLKVLQGKRLTPKEMAISRNKMPKYWKQLMKLSKPNFSPQMVHYVVRESDGQIAIKEVVM